MNTTPTTGTTESAPSPPDINRDRIAVIVGAVSFTLARMELPVDAAPVWTTLVPVEPSHAEYPRERHVRILHEMQVGTVDELTARYREQLARCFATQTNRQEDGTHGVIPALGEASLRKQTEVFERHGCNKDATSMPFKLDPGVLEAREEKRNNLRNFRPRQGALERDVLLRLVGEYKGRRRQGESVGYPLNPPTDEPGSVQELIDALVTLRDDRLLNHNLGVAYHGLTRAAVLLMKENFVLTFGREPRVIRLTRDQITEVSNWPLKSVTDEESWALDPASRALSLPVMICGMVAEEGEVGPLLA